MTSRLLVHHPTHELLRQFGVRLTDFGTKENGSRVEQRVGWVGISSCLVFHDCGANSQSTNTKHSKAVFTLVLSSPREGRNNGEHRRYFSG
jgi:hypothetical protein